MFTHVDTKNGFRLEIQRKALFNAMHLLTGYNDILQSSGVVAEEGRDPLKLKFIVFISSTSLDAREGTQYDNIHKQEAWWN